MMDIDRNVPQGGIYVARMRVSFCLDEFEKMQDNVSDLLGRRIGKRLSIEEIVGALVAAEQALKEER